MDKDKTGQGMRFDVLVDGKWVPEEQSGHKVITQGSFPNPDKLNASLAAARAASVKKRYDALPTGIHLQVDYLFLIGGVDEKQRSSIEHLAVACWEHYDGPFL